MPPTSLGQCLLKLKGSLTNGQGSYTVLHNATRINDAEDSAKHLMSGLFVVYIFAMIEENITPTSQEWPQFLASMSNDDKDKLMAYKHIRHSVAHRIDGERATTHATTFDTVQNRTTMSETIQGATANGNKLALNNNVGFACFQFVQKLVDAALPNELNP